MWQHIDVQAEWRSLYKNKVVHVMKVKHLQCCDVAYTSMTEILSTVTYMYVEQKNILKPKNNSKSFS